MNIKDLIEIGFAKNEALVYVTLARYKESNANQIIKETKLHKKIVYENLEKLIDKGLISFIIEGKIRVYKLNSPESLEQLYEEKIKGAKEEKRKAEELSKELSKISSKIKTKQDAKIYRGKKGIQTFYNELLKIKKDYVVFGAPEHSLSSMGETFWLNLNAKLKERKIKGKLIFNPSIKYYGEKIKSKLLEIKYFERDFEPLTETNIQGDRVAIIVWTDEPILFLIEDKNVAGSYIKFFEKLWKQAKKSKKGGKK